MMLLGLLISAISGGITGLVVSMMHGNGLLPTLLSYPLGGMLAIMTFAAISLRCQTAERG